MTDILTLASAHLVGLTAGLAGGWFLLHRPRRIAPTQAAPATPPAPEPDRLELGLEMHLVLNVLNRVVMALNDNESTQDGVADLADYLRAAADLQRRPSQGSLVKAVTSYWRLNRWVHGHRGDALHFDAQAPGMPPEKFIQCGAALTQLIRDLEPIRRLDVSMRLTAARAGSAAGGATVVVTVANLSSSGEPVLERTGRRWDREEDKWSLQLDLHR